MLKKKKKKNTQPSIKLIDKLPYIETTVHGFKWAKIKPLLSVFRHLSRECSQGPMLLTLYTSDLVELIVSSLGLSTCIQMTLPYTVSGRLQTTCQLH